ncbi:sulfite exporter TauE/SafE family protein [Rubrivirga litoralis]|uniref:Sulfite exporter TauE/SafE family protein n=1 Tax=Rubrivirga litoralis TaxID=3075598 RepID=A0ABU3BNI9_9BACT|nr:sulfite exporter TauE/SafE family protein [Rubrivirga sp. F394]MDT0630835.1 sulfite exporter TauE/SafE family protein [Rubrivirga sp. F394]
MLNLTAAFLAGLLGSAHCVGMCGGFVALLSVGGGPSVAVRQAAYFAGKTATYAAFGALAGGVGALVTGALGAVSGVLSVGLGVAMVLVGLALCGVAWGGARAPGRGVATRLAPAIGRLAGSGSMPALVALGALNGLLPCGLVYGMLGMAASTGSAGGGAATMAVFGLATVPALALTGVLSRRLRPSGRLRLQRLAGVLVVVMGALTVVRGAGALAPEGHSAHSEMVHGVDR